MCNCIYSKSGRDCFGCRIHCPLCTAIYTRADCPFDVQDSNYTGIVTVKKISSYSSDNKANFFGKPENNTLSECGVSPNSNRASLLLAASLIIWEEFPMANRMA